MVSGTVAQSSDSTDIDIEVRTACCTLLVVFHLCVLWLAVWCGSVTVVPKHDRVAHIPLLAFLAPACEQGLHASESGQCCSDTGGLNPVSAVHWWGCAHTDAGLPTQSLHVYMTAFVATPYTRVLMSIDLC